MALPHTFSDACNYFTTCLKHLHDFEWIYNYPNTHILANKIFDKIPAEWINYFMTMSNGDLNKLSLGLLNHEAPKSLQDFIESTNRLIPNIQYNKQADDNNSINAHHKNKNVCISRKKLHEIINLVPVVHDICESNNIRYIIDIGSGLGYLPQLLHERYGYNILGLEANKEFVVKAQKSLTQRNKHAIKYRQLFVGRKSSKDVLNLLLEEFKHFDIDKDRVCLVALHACADLTVDILINFKELSNVIASGVVVMPCCYHRLQGGDDDKTFNYFPLSAQLVSAYTNEGCFLTRPFLRLACQQTNAQWSRLTADEHQLAAKNCLYRNALQEIANEEGVRVERQKRKTGYKKTAAAAKPNDDFNEYYVAELNNSYHFSGANNERLAHAQVERIKATLRQRLCHSGRYEERLFEALAGLQALVQSVSENLILYDRCVFLNQLDDQLQCETIKVTDDQLSPRCYALIAQRHKNYHYYPTGKS